MKYRELFNKIKELESSLIQLAHSFIMHNIESSLIE